MKSKRIITNLIVVLIFLVGLSLLLYPTVSNYINTKNQSYAIVSYDKNAAQLDKEKYEKIMADAREYNRTMGTYQNNFALDESRTALYNSLLNISDDGIMGYVDIPCINCKLPIYHGTNEAVLRVAIGHVEWSSLPVGGESTHSVISGHRGLPSAELLTHIDRLELGDTFYINVLNEKLEYRVDSINVVLPEDTSKLEIVEGQDYVTLVTCTPYGVNSHRLLVRGIRVNEGIPVYSDGQLLMSNEIKPVSNFYTVPIIVFILAAIVSVVYGIYRLMITIKKKGGKNNEETN